MSQDQDQARRLAERIARSVSQGNGDSQQSRSESSTDVGQELSVMRASLEELQQRLARIEAHVTRDGDDSFQSERRAERASEQGSAQQPQARQPVASSDTSRSPWLS